MTALFAIGVGASGDDARARVDAGTAALAERFVVRAVSHAYDNPPWGGATRAPFCNGVVVVDSALPLQAVYGVLRDIERRCGRVRTVKNAARSLDLDVLWSPHRLGPLAQGGVSVPHPRLWQRGFALVPLVEALEAAAVLVPFTLRRAAQLQTLRPPLRANAALRPSLSPLA